MANAKGYKKHSNNRVKNPVKELRRVSYTLRHTKPELSDAEVQKMAAELVTKRCGWYAGTKRRKVKGA